MSTSGLIVPAPATNQAGRNIGASSPEDIGEFIAWGETQTRLSFNLYNYSYFVIDGDKLTIPKYNYSPKYGQCDYKTVLDPEDDAATVRWGGNWRMPVAEEIVELYKNTTRQWTEINGVPGYKFTSKMEGYTDNWIFLALPTGYKWGQYFDEAYDWGVYFGASLIDPEQANIFYFQQGHSYTYAYGSRAQGLPVRAVEGEFVPVTSISLDKTEVTIKVGEVYAPQVTMLPQNATSYIPSGKVDDTSIASINNDDNVVGVAPGVTTYRAYAHNGLIATCTVTVTAAE